MKSIAILALGLFAITPAFGQTIELTEPTFEPTTPESTESRAHETPAGTKRALIMCGHPGDADHRPVFAESIESLHGILVEQYGFAAENIAVLFGAETNEEDGPALRSSNGVAERERVMEEIANLHRAAKPEDTVWVVVLGHAHFDGRRSWWNLPGPDINDREFGEAFRDLPGREQLFLVTTAVSGYHVKGLSAPGRIVITATEPDLETNEPFFHLALVDVLRDLPENEEFDADDDGRLTMFDLYLGIVRNVVDRYLADGLIVTEHARLDDNGDGRSTELQIDYLTVEQGGRAKEGTPPPIVAEGTDGFHSRSILVQATKRVEEEPTEDATEADADSDSNPDSDDDPDADPDADPDSASPDDDSDAEAGPSETDAGSDDSLDETVEE